MSQEKVIKFKGGLSAEAWIRSILAGAAVGGLISFAAFVAFWFLDFNGLIVGIAAFAVVTAAASVLFFFFKFRPTVIKNARRLDRYGLEERLVTMVELNGVESCIAKKQREDAIAALDSLDTKQVKLRVPALIITLSIVFCLLFAGMATVETLSEMRILPTGAQVWSTVFPPEPLKMFDVKYVADAGGYIIGEANQDVQEGSYSSRVLAAAEDGYMFYAWSDGEKNPSRRDMPTEKDIELTAYFIKVTEKDDKTEDGDEPDDVPGDDGNGNPSQSTEGMSPGKYTEINNIINNKDYYRDHYEEYYKRVIEMAEKGEQIPEDLMAIVEIYFEIIK